MHSHVVGGDKPPVILVHGAANSARVWTFWRRELDLSVEGASHWGLVLSRRALRTLARDVVGWLDGVVTG